MILLVLAIASLLFGLWSSLSFFWGSIDQKTFFNLLLAATLSYFVFATAWAYRRPK
ncbi:MAG: hypothetical protein HY820_10900 [Acidobacteria bacterium]|nr:hypothetical protein [Acidobacteriota bacterium]